MRRDCSCAVPNGKPAKLKAASPSHNTFKIQPHNTTKYTNNIHQQAPSIMASTESEYVSPYKVTKRIRRSVMAAQSSRKSIHAAHQRDLHKSPKEWHPAFKPEFDGESFSSALGFATVVLEGLCFAGGAQGWDQKQQWSGRPEGDDRAVGDFLFLLLM